MGPLVNKGALRGRSRRTTFFLALASRRFHGQNSDHKCENLSHELLTAVSRPDFFDAATVRPYTCGIEEWWLPWPDVWPWKRLESVTRKIRGSF